MKKLLKRTMIVVFSVVATLSLAAWIFLQQPKFGKHPSGLRLERITKSPNYKEGAFQNINYTPMLAEDASYFSVMQEFIFSEKKRSKPIDLIPSVKTNLLTLDARQNILVWFGHSSYFMQLEGKRILVDPVFSGAASPMAFTTKAFQGTDAYTTEDFPEIDYLFITHDHWDHLDYKTILKLKPKIKKVICPLGVGEHLEYWGYETSRIIENDWNESALLDSGFSVHTVSARHFSGRGITRGKSIWASYVFQAPTTKVFIGGDSGYDTHFKQIGKNFGPFDLAILENGQYDKSWKYIHMMPNEVLQAAMDLNAKHLFPVHSSKFALANHNWDDPLKQITEFNKSTNLKLVTPIIGEVVHIKDSTQKFSEWWTKIN